MNLLAKVMSCLESTWSLTASNLVRRKCGNQSAFCELYVSQSEEGSRLGDDLGCASSGWWARARRWHGSLWRDKQRSISQLLLSKRQRSRSQQVGGPAESQHCLYLRKFLNCLQSISSAKTMTLKKVQILFVLMQEEISRQDDLLRSCKLDRVAQLRMFNAG